LPLTINREGKTLGLELRVIFDRCRRRVQNRRKKTALVRLVSSQEAGPLGNEDVTPGSVVVPVAVILINAEAGAARGAQVSVKIAVSAGAFHQVEHRHLGQFASRRQMLCRCSPVGLRLSPARPLHHASDRIVVLVAVENHVHAVVFENLATARICELRTVALPEENAG